MTVPVASPAAASGQSDDGFGRVPGCGPPLATTAVRAWVSLVILALAVTVLVLQRPPGPLDQADPADQRNGLLLSGPVLPQSLAGQAFGDHVVVLLFQRTAPTPQQMRAWRSELADDRDVRLVLPSQPSGAASFGVPVVVDPGSRLARAVALPRPNDGGTGVGYAVVDSRRTVRYATLDPNWLRNAFEVATIATSVE